jgi:dihydroflavonol-4-reductase
MKPILVTGGTGFLGKHLVQLLRQGESPVRILTRADNLSGVEVVRGDITNPADVENAVRGSGQIYHLAGLVSRKRTDADRMHRIHVEGTRLVCEAAALHGVERVVVVSSSGTIAVSRKPVVHDETFGYQDRIVARWAYYVTKIEQERLALQLHHDLRLPLVVVNPSLLLGPGDDRVSSTGDIAAFLSGQVLSLPRGGLNLVDVRDCAAGLVQAMHKGRAGQRYLLGGVNWTFREFFREVATIAGVKCPKLSSPTWLTLAMAPLLRRLMPLIGRRFDIDDTSIEMSGAFWYCDSKLARRELGFRTRSPEQTLSDTIAYIRRRTQ